MLELHRLQRKFLPSSKQIHQIQQKTRENVLRDCCVWTVAVTHNCAWFCYTANVASSGGMIYLRVNQSRVGNLTVVLYRVYTAWPWPRDLLTCATILASSYDRKQAAFIAARQRKFTEKLPRCSQNGNRRRRVQTFHPANEHVYGR